MHSPFVYKLVTECFYDKKPYGAYKILKAYRKALTRNRNLITVTDFGAGSRVFKAPQRAVRQIAKQAGVSQKRAKLLFRLAQYFQPQNILELGTSLGLGTIALYLGHRQAQLTTVEGCPNTLELAKAQFANQLGDTNFKTVRFVNDQFQNILKPDFLNLLLEHSDTWNLIYIDGHHSKAATLQYIETLLPYATNKTLWILDDIHLSPGMTEAWEHTKQLPEVTVTIDTFHWGLVFFRTEQVKQHFVIRS